MATLTTKVLHVTKTTEEWENETTIISKGLLCIEFATDGRVLAKIGDGENMYSNLKYLGDGSIDLSEYITTSDTLVLNCTL